MHKTFRQMWAYIALYILYVALFGLVNPALGNIISKEAALTYDVRFLMIYRCGSYMVSAAIILLFSHVGAALPKKTGIFINLILSVISIALLVWTLFQPRLSEVFMCLMSGACLFDLAHALIKPSNP